MMRPVRYAQLRPGCWDWVDRNARRPKTMIEDMLTTSKIELGAFTARLHPLDLAGLVPAAADVIRPSVAKGGLKFEVSCPDREVLVDGDPEQLDRLLVNLLSNAVKYTPKGGSVAVTVDSAGDSAVLTVADTGISIPEKDQGSLSTRFFLASNAVEAAIPGSGLGLSIVRAIVTNHHGDLSFESVQDRGTTQVCDRIGFGSGEAFVADRLVRRQSHVAVGVVHHLKGRRLRTDRFLIRSSRGVQLIPHHEPVCLAIHVRPGRRRIVRPDGSHSGSCGRESGQLVRKRTRGTESWSCWCGRAWRS